jgi:hypothetical protein
MPNPATEKVRVPTVQEIAEVHAVARSAAAKEQDLGRLSTSARSTRYAISLLAVAAPSSGPLWRS